MRYILLFLLALPLLICGCRSSRSLERRPHKKSVTEVPARPIQKKRDLPDDDPVFNAIFHRKPQKFENSTLSGREQELLRQQDISRDPALRKIRREQKNSSGGQSDWVFGTKNGSYF
ncbi:MAG: hypothetical protein IJW35_00365 [Lentisphaeria bacterium]|nr:hypothetical protein [Lentisphaeria bacterium]